MFKRLLRILYVFEFLLALAAFLVLWSQAAGQGHVDLVYWYWKLGISLAVAFAAVRATMGAVEGERAWNGRTLRWLAAIVVLMVGAGLLSYYGHLYYEDQDTGDEEEEPALTIHGAGAGGRAPQANSASARSIRARM